MNFGLRAGVTLTRKCHTEREHAAEFLGSAEAVSTPSLISFMEKTARESVQQKLPEGYTTVGTKVDIKHLSAVPIGADLEITTELARIDERRLEFKVKAEWRKEVVGEGKHERYIVQRQRFLEKLREKRALLNMR